MSLAHYQDLKSWYKNVYSQLISAIRLQKILLQLILCALSCVFLFFTSICLSQSSPSKNNINEVIVNSIYSNSNFNINLNTNYIDAQEIEKSGGSTLSEIISEISNINIHSFSTQKKSNQFNIRGSSTTSSSTILVLLDGMKINTNDLGITDLSVINPDKIERIEVTRGSNSVRYGGGASQGLINLISKKNNNNYSSIKIIAGNNELKESYLNSSYGNENRRLMLYGKKTSTAGDRSHNDYNSINFNADYNHIINNDTMFFFKNRIHKDFYQYPGPLEGINYRNNEIYRNNGSILAGQEGRLNERGHQLKIKKFLKDGFTFENSTYYRDYENTFIFSESLSDSSSEEQDKIKQKSLMNETLLYWKSIDDQYNLIFGLELNDQNYYRTVGGQKSDNSEYNIGEVFSKSSFLSLNIQSIKNTQLNIGYRLNKSKFNYSKNSLKEDESSVQCVLIIEDNTESSLPSYTDFINCPLISSTTKKTINYWKNESIEAKGIYNFNQNINMGASIKKTFRLPNTDELALSNQNLKPQNSDRYEANVKINNRAISYNFNLFYYKTNNEIFFQGFSNNGLNFNAKSSIERRGGELSISYNPKSNLSVFGDLGYTDTTYNNNNLPLSPSLSGSLNLNWGIYKDLNLKVNINHTGKQFDGNDFSNFQYPIIDKITLVNTTISNKTKIDHKTHIFSFITVKNLFNKNYVSIAYSDTIYPGPSRSIIGGIKIEI